MAYAPFSHLLLLPGFLLAVVAGKSAFAQSLYEYNVYQQVRQSALRKVVKIVGSGTPGSGVLIGKNGTLYKVLTAGHVIKDTSVEESPEVITYDGKRHLVSTIRLGNCLDVAEITFKSNDTYQTAIADKDPARINEPFVLAGFSEGSLKAGADREVISVSGIYSTDVVGGYTFAYRYVNSKVGWSGGGLFNGRGELIGIHGQAQTTYYAWPGLPLVPKYGQGQGNVKFGIPIMHWLKLGLSKCPAENQPANPEQKATRLLIQGLHAVSVGNYAKAIHMFNEGKSLWPYTWFDEAMRSAYIDMGMTERTRKQRAWDQFYRALSIAWTWPSDRNSEHCPYMRDYASYVKEYSLMYSPGAGFPARILEDATQRDIELLRSWHEKNCN